MGVLKSCATIRLFLQLLKRALERLDHTGSGLASMGASGNIGAGKEKERSPTRGEVFAVEAEER